jgi:hypothetical protein
MDPHIQKIIPVEVEVERLCQPAGDLSSDWRESHIVTPLDFVKPAPDIKILITPFWFAPNGIFKRAYGAKDGPAQTLPNSRLIPEHGIGTTLMNYMVWFQTLYSGLHVGFA